MTIFPFLNLPPTVQGKVLRQTLIIDLFHFSQCSKRAFNSVKSAHSSQEREFILCNILEEDTIIELASRGDESPDYRTPTSTYWIFYHRRNAKRLDSEDPIAYKIDGVPGTIDFFELYPTIADFGCSMNVSDETIVKFTENLINLFNPVRTEWTFDPMRMDLVKKLTKLEAYKKSDSVHIRTGIVTSEEMNTMLDNETERLWSECHPGYNFVLDKVISTKNLGISRGSWLNREHLRNFDCKKVRLHDCRLTNEDYNSFIRHWLNGTDRKLEYLFGYRDKLEENVYEYDLNQIVWGLSYIPGSPKREDATEYRFLLNFGDPIAFEHGYDFRRADGMLATAMIIRNEEFKSGVFVFIVWHHDDPFLRVQ